MRSIAAVGVMLLFSIAGTARADAPRDVRGSEILLDNGSSRRLIVAPSVEAESEEANPVLLMQEKVDVDGDGLDDTISYFSDRPNGPLEAQSIEFGAPGKIAIVAVRCDYDRDGREDDWLVINAVTEDVKAALVDTNDDGEVDLVDLGNGRTEPFQGQGPHLPVASR